MWFAKARQDLKAAKYLLAEQVFNELVGLVAQTQREENLRKSDI